MSTRFEIPHFEIPRLRTLARHATPHVIEGTASSRASASPGSCCSRR